jgi:hypothetical protein
LAYRTAIIGSVLLVLVAYRKLFNPLLIMRILIASNALPEVLFGGIDIGTFTTELVLNAGLIQSGRLPK